MLPCFLLPVLHDSFQKYSKSRILVDNVSVQHIHPFSTLIRKHNTRVLSMNKNSLHQQQDSSYPNTNTSFPCTLLPHYDVIIIGGGSGGLTAAEFSLSLGNISTLLVSYPRIGGDCTWAGCIPSKSFLHVASIAKNAIVCQDRFVDIISSGEPLSRYARPSPKKVFDYVHEKIDQIYSHETPDILIQRGLHVSNLKAVFKDKNTIALFDPSAQQQNDIQVTASKFIIATGASPIKLPFLESVPLDSYWTYETLYSEFFSLRQSTLWPHSIIIIGAGPIGLEMAQAFIRFGVHVTLIYSSDILPNDDPEAVHLLTQALLYDAQLCHSSLTFVQGTVSKININTHAKDLYEQKIVTLHNQSSYYAQEILVATGRSPNVQGLGLENAAVQFSLSHGIKVNSYLQTNVPSIFAAGDVTGSMQFTHLAGYQAFQAIRNALLPFPEPGSPPLHSIPWTTFTDPEIAKVGLSELEAKQKFGQQNVTVTKWDLGKVDRAVCDDSIIGFIKIITAKNKQVLGASILSPRAGEIANEIAVAISCKSNYEKLARAMHIYPTYSMPIQQIGANLTLNSILNGFLGKILRILAKRNSQG